MPSDLVQQLVYKEGQMAIKLCPQGSPVALYYRAL